MTADLLDAKDYAILRVLDSDVRASTSQIGRAAKLSQEVVHYRLRKLEERGIITGYWALLNLGAEYVVYKVLIKNKSLSKKDRDELVQYLLNQPIISWFADTEGNYDYVITVFAKEDRQFSQFLVAFLGKFGSHFHERHILKATHAITTNEKYLSGGKLVSSRPLDFLEQLPPPDETDALLMRELSLNSRVTYTELGQKAKLTPEAIAHRVKNLEKNKRVLGYKVRVDVAKLGLAYYHVFITLQDQGRREELAQYYTAHPDCVFLMHHVGAYDLHLEFVLPHEKIDEVMDELRERFGSSLAGYELLYIRKEHTLHMLR